MSIPVPAGARASLTDTQRLAPLLAAWLSARRGAPVRVERMVQFPVGFSWITFGVSLRGAAGAEELILRLGPPDGLFAPYSARPEFEVLSALHGRGVPVPRAHDWCDDAAVLGAPFFLCEKVAGEAPIPWVSGGQSSLQGAARDSLAADFVDALAALHRFDWRATALAGWAGTLTRENAAEQQIAHWWRGYLRWRLRPLPAVHQAFAWLHAQARPASHLCIVHGDYRIGNFLEVDGRMTAMLDWELVHLGDPHEDLAWAMLPQYRAGSGLVARLLTEGEFLRRYEEKSGIAVDAETLRFYTVLSLVKLALTHLAACRCFEDGRFNDMRMPAMATQIAPVLRQLQKLLGAA